MFTVNRLNPFLTHNSSLTFLVIHGTLILQSIYIYIFAIQCRRLLLFQTMNCVISNTVSLKYQSFTPSGYNDIGIRKNSVHLCLHISRVALNLNFRAGSTFLVPVCTVSPGRWVNKADTQKDYSRCNMVDAVRLQVEFTFIAGSEVRDIDAKIYQESGQCNLFLKTKAYSF